MAAYSGNTECLQLLMPFPETLIDAFNRSLLHYAANAHTSDAVDYLLKNFKHKFDINGRDINGWTSLHYASARDHDDKPCVDLLLELGAERDIPDNHGFYALDYAAVTRLTTSAINISI